MTKRKSDPCVFDVESLLPRYEIVTHDKCGRPWKKKVMFRKISRVIEVDGRPQANPEYQDAELAMGIWYLKKPVLPKKIGNRKLKLRVLGKVKI